MGMDENVTDSLSDEDYDPAYADRDDEDKDDNGDHLDVLTLLDLALLTDTSSAFLHQVHREPIGLVPGKKTVARGPARDRP